MTQALTINSFSGILDSITDLLSYAENSFLNEEVDAEWCLECAFVRTRLLLEAAGMLESLRSVQRIEATAMKNLTQSTIDRETGEPYFVWGTKLRQYLTSLNKIFGDPKTGIVAKEVIQILRATQYSITDRTCFPTPPKDERELHVRIEAVLRCVFPDLKHKPTITKPIKHFEPDTGLPSIRTLIEYKFISSHSDAKRVSEEILADTRGYVSKDWDQFIYVIYETKRVKSEPQWNQLLRECDVPQNTSAIVISGEEPFRRKRLGRVRAKNVTSH